MSRFTEEESFWEKVDALATELKSDGCTGVTNFHKRCCYLHDIYYRTGKCLDGEVITRAEADREFRECIQARSKFKKLSPMSWWRWAGVRLFGGRAWKPK